MATPSREKPKEEERKKDERIKTIAQRYDRANVQEFLRGLNHIISFSGWGLLFYRLSIWLYIFTGFFWLSSCMYFKLNKMALCNSMFLYTRPQCITTN